MAAADPRRRGCRREAAQADPQLGRRSGRPESARRHGFETITETRRIVLPKHVPGLSLAANGPREHLAPQPPVRHVVGGRAPSPETRRETSVSIVVPCRNERGNVRLLVERVPEIGTETEIVFVEGGSRDGTRGEIEDVVSEPRPIPTRFVEQTGTGWATPSATVSRPPRTSF